MAVNRLEWSNINLVLSQKDRETGQFKQRRLLDNMSGRVSSGQLLAVMGPTGCGKTSLLNVLSGRIQYSRNMQLTGNIFYNGEFMSRGLTLMSAAYVAQDESLFAFLTVRETLTLAAYFHAAQRQRKEECEHQAEEVMRELALLQAADTILGNENRRGVSGGEYRRVLIGKELLKKPAIIFLDEPTSGLDSFQALSVMDTMKRLALHGRIVVAVIHQPRSAIFAMFDRLILLSNGQLMFFGPVEHSVGYFRSLGYSCPEHFNPADYFLDILSLNLKSPEAESDTRTRIAYFHKAFTERRKMMHFDSGFVEIRLSNSGQQYGSLFLLESNQACRRWFSNFGILIWRSFANTFRNYGYFIVRGGTTIFFAVLISLLYRDLDNSQKGIQNREGLLYFVLINQGFSPLIVTLAAIPVEKAIVTREIGSGSYHLSSYYIGKVASECLIQIIFAICYGIIIYWSTGLYPTADRFLIFLGILLLTTLNATALGYLISSLSPNSQIANVIGPPIFIILLLFGGFYINASSLPLGSRWVRFLSLVYWGFQAFIINEFRGLTFTCDNNAGRCITTGDAVIENLSFQNGSIGFSCGILAALTVGFFILGYYGLIVSRPRYLRISPDSDEGKSSTCPERIGYEEERKEMRV